MQLDLFESNEDEIFLLRKEVKELKESMSNVRRGLFARHTDLCKFVLSQSTEIEELKEEIFKLRMRM